MNTRAPFASLALALTLPSAVLAQALETRGAIEAVTVYRGQALVTRLIDIPAAAGNATGVREVVVTDLPSHIRPESLHAEAGGAGGLRVQSVRFRQRPVIQDTREGVRTIDAQIQAIGDRQAANRKSVELINEHRALLQALQQFVAPTATVELTKGVLNAETLQKLSGYIREQRLIMTQEELKLATEARTIQADMDQAQRERAELTAASSRTAFEAVVLVSSEPPAGGGGGGGGAGKVHLRYLVDDATWSPSYNIRAESQAARNASQDAKGPVTLEYYASIQQMTGEDWSGVTMTLSTATPSLIAKAPTLTPMTLTLASIAQTAAPQARDYAEARKDLAGKQREIEVRRNASLGAVLAINAAQAPGATPAADERAFDKSLNEFASSIQVLDLTANEQFRKEQASPAGRPRATEEGLSVTYSIPVKTSLPSRSDRQLIQIASLPLTADFAKIATPVLTGYVYDEARAVNNSQMVLLAGPFTAYSDGSFVGSGDLPTVAIGQSFTAGFGIDSALHSGRELVERTESTQGGNRVVTLTYRLSVENFSGQPVTVRVLDRLPKVKANGHGAAAADIKVTFVDSTAKPMESKEDAALQKDGIYRWSIEVPPQATGAQAATVEYTFRLEYDKQMSLAGMGG